MCMYVCAYVYIIYVFFHNITVYCVFDQICNLGEHKGLIFFFTNPKLLDCKVQIGVMHVWIYSCLEMF